MQYKFTYEDFITALQGDVLLGLRCRDCGAYTVPPKKVCMECASEALDVVEFSGEGVVRTFTVVRVPPEGFEAPYVLGLVELDEGPWLLGRLTAVHPDEVSTDIIGKRVVIGHMELAGDKFSAGDRVIVTFEPA